MLGYFHSVAENFDALLVLSFGGPEGPDDVMPFLENVTRGRGIPRERLAEVAEHYLHFGGVSPINEQNRALIAALVNELNRHHIELPVYWGNRNWHPFLADALRQMADEGIRRALVFVTSIYSSYSGCRQYREDIARAQTEVGETAPHCAKIRPFYNHPLFIETMTDRVRDALEQIPPERRSAAKVLFSAHSIPNSMAATCDYQVQLEESRRMVAENCGVTNWQIVYQSRSGPPQMPWLEPDVCAVIRELGEAKSVQDVVIVPIGFVSDHMEVLYDLDDEAAAAADEAGLNFVRAGTAGTHPTFIAMIRELIEERIADLPPSAVGRFRPRPHECAVDCCKYEPRRPGG